MNLHIFNPEHDIVLGYNKSHISVPHAAQELRMNLGFLPMLWAEDGDAILVDDIKYALKVSASLRKFASEILFVEHSDLKSLPIQKILPWGWDKRINSELLENGVDKNIVLDETHVGEIRLLSDRVHTSNLLKSVRQGIESLTCGESILCITYKEVESQIKKYRNLVVKAPWSSSGRGIRYVNGSIDSAKKSWIDKVISRQGHVMVEPYYNKVCDFALEYYAYDDGRIEYRGLSVFQTVNGKYAGNVIANEEYKRLRLGRYVDMQLLDFVKDRIKNYLSSHLLGKYSGPLGVDMMAVADKKNGKLLLHPCVEINLRRTMGHVALALAQKPLEYASVMNITHKVNYNFNIERIEGKFVNVIYR